MKKIYFIYVILVLAGCGCSQSNSEGVKVGIASSSDAAQSDSLIHKTARMADLQIIVGRDVTVVQFYKYLDSLLSSPDSIAYPYMNEYLLVLSNPRILDTLMGFDYYYAKEQGRLITDQPGMVVLHGGDTLLIPDMERANKIQSELNKTVIDVNIPEFKLRIFQGDSIIYTCAVRVGKNERRYLKLAGHEVDLRTPIGDGEIVRIEKNPWYINPVDGHRYKGTWRDDGIYTKLPQIPFLEPSIEGIRRGSLIHPTTNKSTLGKAISNGCVGVSEADAWMIYYHAPIGTKVRFRYDLEVIESSGDTTRLKDIYNRTKQKTASKIYD